MTKHTPGPWACSKDAVPEGYVQTTVYEESTDRRVATVFEREGNARLIAAAPDMLEALQTVFPPEESAPLCRVPTVAECRRIRDIIAKATGE